MDEDKFPAKRLSFDDNEPVTDESFLTVSSAQADSTKMLSVDVGVAMTPVTLNSVSVATDLVQMSSVAVETDPLPDWEYKARQYQEKLAEAEEKIVTLENELEKVSKIFLFVYVLGSFFASWGIILMTCKRGQIIKICIFER